MPLISDWNGEATRAFDIAFEPREMEEVPMRSCFLVEDGERIVEAWMLGRELPDLDAVIEAARTRDGLRAAGDS